MKVIGLPRSNLRQRIGGKARIHVGILGCSLVSFWGFISFFLGQDNSNVVFFSFLSELRGGAGPGVI